MNWRKSKNKTSGFLRGLNLSLNIFDKKEKTKNDCINNYWSYDGYNCCCAVIADKD